MAGRKGLWLVFVGPAAIAIYLAALLSSASKLKRIAILASFTEHLILSAHLLCTKLRSLFDMLGNGSYLSPRYSLAGQETTYHHHLAKAYGAAFCHRPTSLDGDFYHQEELRTVISEIVG